MRRVLSIRDYSDQLPVSEFGTDFGWRRWHPAYSWTAFRASDGLGHNIVTSVVETPDNAVWFATRGVGIARYDGREWRVFTENDGLPGNAVGSLFVVEDGVLWTTGAMGSAVES